MMTRTSDKRIVTIDQGNSSLKAVAWSGSAAEDSVRLAEASVEGLLPLFENGEVDGCVYCSVGHTDAKFLETLRRLVDGRLLVLTHSTPLPIDVVYGSRDTLGNDRVAAAAGAAALNPWQGALVAAAGTALTDDVLDCRGCFRGGNISPGLSLRFDSLHRFTDRLPLVDAAPVDGMFGTDTRSAIRCGVEGGMASEIAAAYAFASDEYGCSRIILTGNDADMIHGVLAARGISSEVHPNLVGLGLLSIYRYNFS